MLQQPRFYHCQLRQQPKEPFRQFHHHPLPFYLTMGGALPRLTLAYETWGTLNEAKDNALLLFTGLSASAHAASHQAEDTPGWWEAMVGPNRALDTNRYFVLCVNHLGSCFGSTGPAECNPDAGIPYGLGFPPLAIRDLAIAVDLVAEALGVRQFSLVVGTSLGGMCALEYAACFPKKTRGLVSISATGRSGPQSIAFRHVQRQLILNDPKFRQGQYYGMDDPPLDSMVLARQIGNISYRSREEWEQRFGRRRTKAGFHLEADFEVETYLQHMGEKLGQFFDPNSFLFLSRAMDLFSLGQGFSSYREGVERLEGKALIIGVTRDMLFPLKEQEELHHELLLAGVASRFAVLDSPAGHDAFLVEFPFFEKELRHFLEELDLKRGWP
jgi:homoserine O-acetyltransferase